MTKATNISHHISEICKEQGIKYCSINPDYKELSEDATRLGEICGFLLADVDEIDRILKKHNISIEFKQKIENDLSELHSIEHDLISLAQKIKSERKANE